MLRNKYFHLACIPHVVPILIGSRVASVASRFYFGCAYPTLLRRLWVVDTQHCCVFIGCGYPTLLDLFGLWIPNVARLIWVVGTQRCSAYLGCGYPTLLGLFGLWIPHVAPASLGRRYPTLVRLYWVVDTQRCSVYLGCGYPTLLWPIWVVDTQCCSAIFLSFIGTFGTCYLVLLDYIFFNCSYL